MKTVKRLVLIIFFTAIAMSAQSIEKISMRGDTIRIRSENYLLEVATFDLKINTLEKADIQNKVNALVAELEKINLKNPEQGEKIRIRWTDFIGGKEQDFKKLELSSRKENVKSLIVSEGHFLETDFGTFVLEIEDKDYLIRLFLEELEDANIVNAKEFKEKILEADTLIPANRKKTNGWLIENEDDTFSTFFIGEVPPLTLDMLDLNAGIGGGWIKNEFVSSFYFRVGLSFAKKAILKNKYFAEIEAFYDFSSDGKFVNNGFLSLGYERNFSLNPDKARWYGISAGYLIDRGNDFFEKNTFNIAIHKKLSNSITLKPEIYFNDFFKNVSPALRVQVTF